MVQYAIFTDKLNNIFPLNIIIIYIIIFIAAYLLKCTAHLFSQVFSNEPFNNKNIYQSITKAIMNNSIAAIILHTTKRNIYPVVSTRLKISVRKYSSSILSARTEL